MCKVIFIIIKKNYFEDDDEDDCSLILTVLFILKKLGSLRVTVIFNTVMLENFKLIQRN